MKKRIVLMIEENEMSALETFAKNEFRTTWQQAALIIRRELEKQGFMEIVNPVACDHTTDEVKILA